MNTRLLAAAATAATSLVPTPPADATTTLTEAQRIEWSSVGSPSAGAHYGARLAMPQTYLGWALIGAPGSGGLEGLSIPTGGWEATFWVWGSGSQPLAMAADGGSTFWCQEYLEGMKLYTKVNRVNPELTLVTVPGAIEAVASAGPILAVGQPQFMGGGGRVLIYEDTGSSGYQLQASFIGGTGDELGTSLAVDGDIIVAGAPGDGPNGAVVVFARTDQWIELQHIPSPATSQADAGFGAAIALRGDVLAIGSPDVDRVTSPGARTDVGGVYVYEAPFLLFELAALLRPAGVWHEDHIGTSVALHDFGNRGLALAAGAPGEDLWGPDLGEGAAHVYTYDDGAWVHLARLIATDGAPGDALGTAVAMGDRGVLAGAPKADVGGIEDQGAVFYFDHVLAIFADGFENGNLSNWSNVAP
jgi:hypothetical protein